MLLAFGGGKFSHNLFNYCENNPANMVDKQGNVALFDDLAVVAFIGLCSSLMLLLGWMATTEVVQSWIAFCQSASNGLSSLGKAITSGGTIAWDWTRKRIKVVTKEIKKFITLVKADEKVRRKVGNKKLTYYEAYYSSGVVAVGKGITQAKAVIRLNSGKNVFTMFKHNAKKVCALAGSAEPMLHSKKHNPPNFYNHYHVNKHINSAHCWYLI